MDVNHLAGRRFRTLASEGLPVRTTQKLLAEIDTTRRGLSSSLPFVAEQFSEHMETVVVTAKVEVNAYVTQTIMKFGLKKLGAASPIEALKMAPQADPAVSGKA